MTVTLAGFMGCGKSSVGKLLAAELGIPFKDLDERISISEGRTPQRIFAEGGEALFRKIELVQLRTALAEGDAVIALGGGTPTIAKARPLIDSTTCIYLKASLESVEARIGAFSEERPLYKPETLSSLYEERCGIYEAVAHIIVETDGRTPASVAEEILELL